MKFMAHILLAVAVLIGGVLGESGEHVRPQWMPLLLLLPYGCYSLWRFWARPFGYRTASIVARISSFSAVIAYAISLEFLGWVDFVRVRTGQGLQYDDWPDWGLVICFVPFVVFQIAAIHAEALVERGNSSPLPRRVHLQVRSLLAAISPLALYMLISVVSARSEVWRVNIESVELFGGMYFLGITLLLGMFMPVLLSHTWETAQLPQGPARQLFEDVAEQAAFRANKVLLWKTDHMVANAAIVGMSKRFRIVLLSDSLLSMLGARELACVYGHEIGHAKRHHVPIFIGWSVFFLLGGDYLTWKLFSPDGWLGMVSFGSTLVVWYYCFGWLSRRFELEADLFSMKLTGDPSALIQALERVGGGNRDRGGWRHFSTARRVSFLHRAAFDDVFRLRFLRRILLLGRAGLFLGACTAILYLGGLVQRFEGDRLHVHLALGTYDATWTAEQAPEGRNAQELGALLETAATLADPAGGKVSLDRLRAVLREALLMGDFEEASRLAQLLNLRRVPVAKRLVEAMNQGPFPPQQDADFESWPEPWRGFGQQGLLPDEN